MLRKYLWIALRRVAVSLLCGGAFYLVWMAIFLFATKLDNAVVEGLLWILAPVVTAAGFATGIVLFDRLVIATKHRFFPVLLWPLVGCAAGAGVVYWFGPMLIVFGMLVAGTASIALREVLALKGMRAKR